MYDIVIIGAGPAGLSAAINGAARNKEVAVFGKISASWIYKAEKINNYLGLPGISGKTMMETFEQHANDLNVPILDKRVLQIFPINNYFSLNVENEFIETKTIIIATGAEKGKALPGEQEYLGKGLSYCATCDGMLYRNKEVVLIGENEEAVEDANFLSEICSVVYYSGKYKEGLNPKVQIVEEKPATVTGELFVNGVSFENREIPCEGVFVIKDSTPVGSLLQGIEMDGNFILTDKKMQTNLQGVYAAGDCTGKPLQVAKAVGDGLVAALSATEYLAGYVKQG